MAIENSNTPSSSSDLLATQSDTVNDAKCLSAEELLAAERKIAIGWWTTLNELRLRSTFSEGMTKLIVGSTAEMDEFRQAVERTNAAILGQVPCFEYEVWGNGQNRISGKFANLIEAKAVLTELRLDYHDAHIVRIFGGSMEFNAIANSE